MGTLHTALSHDGKSTLLHSTKTWWTRRGSTPALDLDLVDTKGEEHACAFYLDLVDATWKSTPALDLASGDTTTVKSALLNMDLVGTTGKSSLLHST